MTWLAVIGCLGSLVVSGYAFAVALGRMKVDENETH